MVKKQPIVSNILAGVSLWFIVWVFTQGIFMSEILLNSPLDINISYLLATVWVLVVLILCVALLPVFRKDSLPKSKLLWLYFIPFALLLYLPWHYALTLNIWVYIPMIVITVFWQDYLTFGVLQSFLAKQSNRNIAATITGVVFLLGHAVFFLNDLSNPQFVLIGIAGFVFAFSRRYAGNIYIANIIHTLFYLI
jgi:membrane protease YdiL (CAAX protease family)